MLATGLDVEYVKSHLSRIVGVDIVVSGMGIQPSECALMIVVPHIDSLSSETQINKSLFREIEEFIEESEEDYPRDYILVYSGIARSGPNDVETGTPMFIEFGDIDENDFDEQTYEDFATMNVLIGSDESLLEAVTETLDMDNDWKGIPAHHMPDPKYQIPPIPSKDDRRLGKMVKDSSGSCISSPFPIQELKARRREVSLLLIRRGRRLK